MTASVFDRLTAWLDEQRLDYQVLRHEPVFTSEQAAQVRGTTLASGAKALVCKADDRFVLFVLPADRRLASKQVRRVTGFRNLRFARREEVSQLTGLTPGAIPPFGSLFDLPTYCDARLAEQPVINFNAGDHALSISMRFADYQRSETLQLGDFTE